jgi:hypothetical protein
MTYQKKRQHIQHSSIDNDNAPKKETQKNSRKTLLFFLLS